MGQRREDSQKECGGQAKGRELDHREGQMDTDREEEREEEEEGGMFQSSFRRGGGRKAWTIYKGASANSVQSLARNRRMSHDAADREERFRFVELDKASSKQLLGSQEEGARALHSKRRVQAVRCSPYEKPSKSQEAKRQSRLHPSR